MGKGYAAAAGTLLHKHKDSRTRRLKKKPLSDNKNSNS